MKKIFLSIFFLAFPFFTPHLSDASFATYSDEALTKKEVNFAPNQMVYVLAKTTPFQKATAILTLLDSSKAKIIQIPTTFDNGNYFAKFSAPDGSGTYYVHVEIKGEGLVFSGEKNINVIGTSEESQARIQSETKSIVSTSEELLPVINKKAVFGDFLGLIRTWISRFFGIFTRAS